MASTSCHKPTTELAAPSNYKPYPAPLARFEDVVGNPKLFMSTLEKLHAEMGTKFMIPIIGGRKLDLHKLFVEVTQRGGIEKIIRERRWKEVTATFNFPPTATNASFVLRKYYFSLLHHYEQIYYFKARLQVPSEHLQVSPLSPYQGQSSALSPLANTYPQQPTPNAAETPGARPASSTEPPVVGVIDGKIDCGYLVTVKIGSEVLKGVLYEARSTEAGQARPISGALTHNWSDPVIPMGTRRRRRRKKSEMKRRDPAHPKPNRSGYNFFFAEQHARLKPLYPGKDREISRMIGERWNKLNECEKAIYQEKALKDKERYRVEMEDYRERLRSGDVISHAVPLQQRLPQMAVDSDRADITMEDAEGVESVQNLEEDDSSSGESDDDDKVVESDSDMEVRVEPNLSGIETLAEVSGLDSPHRENTERNDRVKNVDADGAREEKEEEEKPASGGR